MGQNAYSSRKILSLLLSLVMFFSTLGSLAVPTYAGTSEADISEYGIIDGDSQVIEIPIISEEEAEVKKQEAPYKPSGHIETMSVTESVYEGYALTGWDSVNCDMSVYDYVYDGGYHTYIQEAPIPIYTGGDFASIYDEGMTFNIELNDTDTGETIYYVEDYDIERIPYDDTVKLLGVAYDIEPGTYDICLTAQLGEDTYNFRTVQQTFYCELIPDGKLYVPVDATNFWASIFDIGYIPRYMEDELSFEVQDEYGKIVAQSSKQLYDVEYYNWDNWYIDEFSRPFNTYYIETELFKTGAFEAGKEYYLKLFTGNGIEKTEIILPTQLKVEFTDKPVLYSLGLYNDYDDPLVEGDTGFNIMTNFFNLKNKDLLSFKMLDSDGNVVAGSKGSMYDYIHDLERQMGVIYKLELLPGMSLINGEEYSLQVISSEAGLINRIDFVKLHTDPMPRIMSVNRDLASQGKFILDTINLNVGEEYRVKMEYIPEGYYVFSDKEKPAYGRANISAYATAPYGIYETIAICNSNGQLEVQFKDGDQPISFGQGEYFLDICDITEAIPLCGEWFYIGDQTEYEYQEIYIYYPDCASASSSTYEFGIDFYNIYVTKDNLKIELVDGTGTAVAEADYASLILEEDYEYTYLDGIMKLKEGFTPEVGVEYTYRITIDGIEFPQEDIYENYITFVDRVAAGGVRVRESIYSTGLTGDYYKGYFVSTGENVLNIDVYRVINLNEQNKDMLTIGLYKIEYNEETGEEIATEVAVCNPADIHFNSTYTDIDAVMNINAELQEGEYLIAVKHDGSTIYDRILWFTPGAEDVYIENITAAPADKFKLEFYEAVNIKPEQLSAEIYNINGELKTTADFELVEEHDKYEFDVQFMTGETLEEGCYTVQPFYNGEELSYRYFGRSDNLLRVTGVPVLTFSGHCLENGTIAYYDIGGINLGSTINYKAYFYYEDEEIDRTDWTMAREVDLGTVNDEGRFIITPDALAGMAGGHYYVVVESEDGTTIGGIWMKVYENEEIPSAPADPKVAINKGAACTNSEIVKLYFDAAGYSTVKIAESEAGLAAAEYMGFSNGMTYILSPGDGQKTLFFMFKADNGTESKVITQSIYLDTSAPAAPSQFGLKDSSGNVLQGETVVEGDYLQLFAVGAEKYIKAYARITGTDLNQTIRLGYINQNAEDKSVYAAWIKFGDYYSGAEKITFFFEDYAGNISGLVDKTISVNDLASISGTLYKGSSIENKPAKYQSVLLQVKKGDEYEDYRWAYADQYGNYSFENIPNGEYRMFSYAPQGYLDASEEFTVVDYQDVIIDIEYEDKYSARGSLTVNVKDHEGNSVDGAYVYLSNWGIGEYYYLTTSGGTASFTDIATSGTGMEYYLYVYYNGYHKTAGVTVNAGDNGEMEIEIPAIGSITGAVTDKDGNPVEGADVYAIGTNGEYVWARTAADGGYELKAPKDGTTTYRIYVNDSVRTPNRIWSEIAPDKGDVDFTLYNKPNVFGTVKGDDGNDIETTVYVAGIDPWSWNTVESGSDGAFRFNGLLGLNRYRLGTSGVQGYYSAEEGFEITEADLIAGEKDLGVITLESYSRDIFTGSFNNVRTDVSYIQKGKNITARVNYHNTKDVDLDNVTIKVYIPEGVTLVPGSGALEKKLDRLEADEKGELTFTVKVGDSCDANKVTIKAVGLYNRVEQAIGYADVEVVSATINAPEELVSAKAFKVYGEATVDSEVAIIAKELVTGNESILAVTKPSGRWYYADIKAGLPEGDYKLYAKVTKGNETGFSDYADVSVKIDALYIEDIVVVSPNGQSLGVNEETGVAAFSVWVNPQLEGKPIGACVEFGNADEVPGHFEFIGVDYDADYENGYMKKVIENWSGSGIQKLYYVTDTGKRFVIAEITILIDPSGYVYDRYTNERIEGAVVTCETKDEAGNWIKWDAEKYGQVNPQLTDAEGKYGWMVQDGEYRVKVQKDGYEAYVTTNDGDPKLESIVIPPPRMDVNVGLTNIEMPMVKYTIPENGGAAGVDAQIAVVFTKPMDSSLGTMKFEVTDDTGNKVAGGVSFTDNDTRAVFTPAQALEHGKIYNVLLSGFMDKKDRSGAARALGDYGFSFTANQELKTEYLENTSIVPANGAVNVERTAVVTMAFDKEVDANSVDDTTVKLETRTGERVKAELKTENNTVTLTPENALMAGTVYKLTIESDVKSTDGYYLEKDITSSFTTKAESTSPGGSNGHGSSSSSSTGSKPAVNTISAKVAEAITKGAKELVIAADKDGNAEVLKADIEKLINNKITMVIQNGGVKAAVDLADLKEAISTAAKVKFTLREKSAEALASGYKKLSNILEIKIYADSNEIKINSKVDIRLEAEGLLNGISNNLKSGVYKKTGNTLEYIPGSHVSKKGIVSFKLDSFGEFIVAEYSRKFADMDKYKWASEFVEIMAARQITTGTGGNNFLPEAAVTRAQFAVFITRALGIEIPDAENTFTDVASGKWYTGGIAAAAVAGIVQGDGKGSFNPEGTINREQMAIMVMRAYKYVTGISRSGNAKFEDMSQVSGYAADAVLGAKALGIIEGDGSNRYNPKDESVRAAAAKVIVKLLELVTE